MATLAEQLFNENVSNFENIKAQLTENVMNDIRSHGHHRICSWVSNKVDKIKLSRYPNGMDCTQIHPLLIPHAERYLSEQGLRVSATLNCNDNSVSSIDVSL